MCGGMGVAADDGHTRQRETFLGTYHVDDAIVLRHHAVVGQSEVLGILGQCIHLCLRHWVLDGLVLIMGRCIVVRHAVYLLRTETLQSPGPHIFESLRRGHLMAVQPVNIQLCGAIVNQLDDVLIPDFVK